MGDPALRAAVGFLIAATLVLAGAVIAGPRLAPRDGHGAAIALGRERVAEFARELVSGTPLPEADAAFDDVEATALPGGATAIVATELPGSSMVDLDDPVRVGACVRVSTGGAEDVPCGDAWNTVPHRPDFEITVAGA